MPQLGIQIYFISTTEGALLDNPITTSSIIFSLISIIIAFLAMVIEKTINSAQQTVKISMKVTGKSVTSNITACQRMGGDVKRGMAEILNLSAPGALKLLNP